MNYNNINADSADLWNRAKMIYLSILRTSEEREQAESYFSMISGISLEGNIFRFSVSNKFAADFLTENYSDKLKNAFDLAGGSKDLQLQFVSDPNSSRTIINNIPVIKPQIPVNNTSDSENKAETKKIPTPFISTLPLEENFTFEEFVQGSSNSWAFAAAKGVANNPGQKRYNPLFIHGGTGLGKTHLMQAIGNELKAKNPSMNICYLTAETFLNEYVNSVMQKGMESFRDRYRSIDVLLIDDIQFLQKGKQCQEEFFNTFNDLTANHKQIVMTSDVSPKNLPALEERLISRFEGGMVQEIEAPAYETRLAILKKKAENLTPSIPYSALEFLAEHIKSHVRAIEGALNKVHVTIITNPTQELSNDFLSFILKDVIEKEQTLKKLTIREIQESICKKYNISVAQILSTDRTASLVTPRQLAMYISRKYTTKSLQEIAAEFDKKHATILHGVKTIEKRLDVEIELKNSLEEILSYFGYSISDKME